MSSKRFLELGRGQPLVQGSLERLKERSVECRSDRRVSAVSSVYHALTDVGVRCVL